MKCKKRVGYMGWVKSKVNEWVKGGLNKSELNGVGKGK